MISYTGERTMYGKLAQDSSTANLDLGTTLMNEARRQILTSKPWKFLEKTKVLSTVSAQQSYDLPSDLKWLNDVTVTIGTTKHHPTEVKSLYEWNALNYSSDVQSDIPQYFFLTDSQISFYPIPSSSTSNAITFTYGRKQKDLSIEDYTTGTIVSITNGASAVVGDSTVWTPKMAGSWLRITDSYTANTGDGEWYEIASSGSSTTITLDRLYNGTSISVGTAPYTIAQVSLLPEEYDFLPIYKALTDYFSGIKIDAARAKLFNDKFVNLYADMQASESGKSSSPILRKGLWEEMPLNVNNYPSSIGP